MSSLRIWTISILAFLMVNQVLSKKGKGGTVTMNMQGTTCSPPCRFGATSCLKRKCLCPGIDFLDYAMDIHSVDGRYVKKLYLKSL